MQHDRLLRRFDGRIDRDGLAVGREMPAAVALAGHHKDLLAFEERHGGSRGAAIGGDVDLVLQRGFDLREIWLAGRAGHVHGEAAIGERAARNQVSYSDPLLALRLLAILV
jgi:hypothetical protein